MSEHPLGSEARPLRVAVVGSGPSGFYAVQALFKKRKEGLNVSVDLFDRLPTPYGLVRGGVAPDHQKIKSVIKAYDKIAAEPGFRFFGNVMLGRDLEVADLVRHYDQIVYATGNESDRRMGLPGEDLQGVYSATEFVGWYNGHPDFRDREFDLAHAQRAVVIGIGNVAVDVARVLARGPDELADTDIAGFALDVLRTSAVEEVVMAGRRGPAQSAFSPKEIKELASIPNADFAVQPEQMVLDDLSRTWLEEAADRDAKKNVEYLNEAARTPLEGKPRRIRLEFMASPVEFLGDNGRLVGVVLEKNELYADARGTPRSRGTGERWREECQLVFKAVGYRGVPISGVPFREDWGIFPNESGRLLEATGGPIVPGQYVVGWAKRGPSGLIGTNSPCSVATVDAMLEDIQARTAQDEPEKRQDAIEATLRARAVDYVTFEDWQRLDRDELERGKSAGKIREKYTSLDDMMAAIHRLREPT
jgi:ferredoxin/flavodoxin---NADP+ reductase